MPIPAENMRLLNEKRSQLTHEQRMLMAVENIADALVNISHDIMMIENKLKSSAPFDRR